MTKDEIEYARFEKWLSKQFWAECFVHDKSNFFKVWLAAKQDAGQNKQGAEEHY